MLMKSVSHTVSGKDYKNVGEQFIFPTLFSSCIIRLVTLADGALGLLLLFSLPVLFYAISVSPHFLLLFVIFFLRMILDG